ncbi:Dihydroorotate oxidase B, electron transfer subunit [Candidatus Electrothrix laxa]
MLEKDRVDFKGAEKFILQPFQKERFAVNLQVSGTLDRSATDLQVSYKLRGNLDSVRLPFAHPTTTTPRRRDELWQTTCFEFFVAVSGSPQYWEVNLSPSGDWNVYAFTEYRQGMREESSITALSFSQHLQNKFYQLALDFPLAQLVASDQSIDVAVSVILQGHNGQRGFYALTHCDSQPDFHQRESFLVRL